jgi:Fuc2NAc and GlcNAc transferase
VTWWVFISAFFASVAITGLLRAFSGRLRLVDIPNERSSHAVPVPRGGGLAIVLVTLLALFAAWYAGVVEPRLFVGVGVAGTGIGLVGLLDDRFSIRAGVRLLVHILGVGWFITWCWPLLPVGISGDSGALTAIWVILVLLGVVSAVNVFNFMDGIDGLGGGQGVFLSSAAVWLLSMSEGGSSVEFLLGVVAATSAGFLLWNISTAKIFLGDVGSGFLGFILAALPLIGSGYTNIPVATWLILWGVFAADAGTTLIRRIIRRDRWYMAHRSHAYQALARRLSSHRLVSLIYLALDIVWLLPLAWCSIRLPQYAELLVCLALAPLIALAWGFGAGAPESKSRSIP